MDQNTRFLPGLSPVEGRELRADFDGGALSSDGGVLVLREIEPIRMGSKPLWKESDVDAAMDALAE